MGRCLVELIHEVQVEKKKKKKKKKKMATFVDETI